MYEDGVFPIHKVSPVKLEQMTVATLLLIELQNEVHAVALKGTHLTIVSLLM